MLSLNYFITHRILLKKDSEEEVAILEDNQFQTLVENEYEADSLAIRDNMDVSLEKLNEDNENVQLRDCPSRFSTLTSSSKLSVTRMNQNESSNDCVFRCFCYV